MERILAWDFDRVIVAHGDVLDRSGQDALRRGYAWLLEDRVAGRTRSRASTEV
jgi:hypothetical protein